MLWYLPESNDSSLARELTSLLNKSENNMFNLSSGYAHEIINPGESPLGVVESAVV